MLNENHKRGRGFLANHAFIAISVVTVVAGIGANAALFSTINVYFQPERVASGVVKAMTLADMLFSIWLSVRAIC